MAALGCRFNRRIHDCRWVVGPMRGEPAGGDNRSQCDSIAVLITPAHLHGAGMEQVEVECLVPARWLRVSWDPFQGLTFCAIRGQAAKCRELPVPPGVISIDSIDAVGPGHGRVPCRKPALELPLSFWQPCCRVRPRRGVLASVRLGSQDLLSAASCHWGDCVTPVPMRAMVTSERLP
jgi:hypothetical protein